MLTVLLRWWVTQLVELLPAGLARTDQGAGNALIIEPAAAEIWLIERRHGRETRLGHCAVEAAALARLATGRRDAPVLLRPPPGMLLERQVVLPLAAERELANVLRYEMDRLTPFPADQLYWAASTERRDPARGKLTLRLAMIPRPPLAPLLGALAAAGLAPGALELGDGRLINLSETRGPARPAGTFILAAACAVLALIAVALPFEEQSRHAAALQRERAAVAPRAAEAEALRRRLLATAATHDVFAAEAARTGDPLAALAAVTAALPDNSYLTALTLNHRQLGITGQATAAAGLLAALSAYPILTNVAFSAPVTRDTTGQKDLFSIQSTVAAP